MTDPVVFLPGSLCDERVFEHQLLTFGDDGMIVPLTKGDSIEELATNVLDQAPERFVLVGLSLGAIVAAEVAVRASERVMGLCLLDTNLGVPDTAQIATRTRWAQMARSGKFASMLGTEWVSQLTAYPNDYGSLIFEMAYDMGPAVFLAQNRAVLSRRDRRGDLEGMNHPILIGCGAADALCPPALHQELAARSPNAELVVFDGCGHLSTLDQAEVVTGTLTGWLDLCNINTIPGGVST